MGMKANEVGEWLRRQHSRKRDHHEALRDDVVVIRPGPLFDWFMRSLEANQATPEPPQTHEGDRDPHQE